VSADYLNFRLRSQVNNVKQQEILEITIRNARRLQRLTNDILDVTKIEARTLELYEEDFNLNEVVINAMNDITVGTDSRKNENINLSYNPLDILIRADKGRISQVISNLLTNAIKFTTQGSIVVRALLRNSPVSSYFIYQSTSS
jgi:signal transduction histidine kinase